MIKEIVKDEEFLKQKSISATKDDLYIIQDLKDTIAQHPTGVGLASVQIGYLKRIVLIKPYEDVEFAMVNPIIIKRSSEMYDCVESCLSLEGERPTKRYRWIEVIYSDNNMKTQKRKYTGFTAQVIQHEIDHCNGILI